MSNNNIERIYSLAPMQEGMLFHKLMNEDTTEYILQDIIHIEGTLDIGRMKQGLELLMQKYDVLRTAIIIPKTGAQPLQVVLKNREAELNLADAEQYEGGDKEVYLKLKREEDLRRGFDFAKDNLLRVTIIKISEYEYEILWTCHHIIMDGWCTSLLFRDLMNYYQILKEENGYARAIESVTHEKMQILEYGDYLDWINQNRETESLQQWKLLLEDYQGDAHIKPFYYSDRMDKRIVKRDRDFIIEDSFRIQQFTVSNHITVSTLFETAWGLLLQQYNNSKDVVFGKVVSGRNIDLAGIEQAVGLFINTIPARVKCGGAVNVMDLLLQMQEQVIHYSAHEHCSLTEIKKAADFNNESIKTLYVFENYYIDEAVNDEIDGLKIEITNSREETNYDITVLISNTDCINVSVMYNANRYMESEIELLLSRYIALVNTLVLNPHKNIADIYTIPEEEYSFLNEINHTDVRYDNTKSVIDCFEEQCESNGDKTAIICGKDVIRYEQFNQKANQIAAKLIEHGVGRGDLVAVIMDRSIEMMIGIYAILKAGAAYVPIDPNFPQERMEYITADCNSKVYLVAGRAFAINIPYIDLADPKLYSTSFGNPKRETKPSDLAYVIYTSGTTGQPKGVMCRHDGLLNRIQWMQEQYPLQGDDTVLQKTTYTFDVSVWEILWWGMAGARLVLLPIGGEKEPSVLIDEINTNHVTVMHFVPSMLNAFLLFLEGNEKEVAKLKSLHSVFSSGEALKIESLKMFNELIRGSNEKTRLINLYGPTEASIDVTYFNCEYDYSKLPIGKPIANIQIHIQNEDGLCSIGIPGELCIAGIGLAEGYLNKPELTQEKFIQNPYGEGKLYRTGDLARWLPDGNIEYLGRMDHQVKIRGLRIELLEIERALYKIAGIKEAAVIAKEDNAGDNYICAYLVSDERMEERDIKALLSKWIPEYMIPSYIMYIEKIPVTHNGKLDRHALPEAETSSFHIYVEPVSETEVRLSEIFQTILGVERVGAEDNFFDLGGDSIKAIRIISKMREAGYELTVMDVMKTPVLRELARKAVKIEEKLTYEQDEIYGMVPLTPIQQEFLEWDFPVPNYFNQAVMLKSKHRIFPDVLKKCLEAIVKHHDGLRIVWDGKEQRIQSIHESLLFELQVCDLRQMDSAEEREAYIVKKAEGIQNSIRLTTGPLLKAGLFQTADGDHLLLCIHHFAVDGVSFQIILEDISVSYKRYLQNQTIVLPEKTASYKKWAEALKSYSESRQLQQEAPYWLDIHQQLKEGRLLGDRSSEDDGTHMIVFELEPEETSYLLYESSKAFGTEINDILLAALSIAVKRLTGQNKVAVELEGHGREPLDNKILIDRTVGWFTSIYPVIITNEEDPCRLLISTKEMLRHIPNHGIGYGILKHTGQFAETEKNPDIRFNYLGDFDHVLEDDSDFMLSELSTGACSSDQNKTECIVINANIADKKLQVDISYEGDIYDPVTMKKFSEYYENALLELINLCRMQKETVQTTSDYTTLSFTHDELNHLKNRIKEETNSGIQRIYSLTPMQEGMLFHKLLNEGASEYVLQNVFQVRGTIHGDRMVQSLQLLMSKYDVLRTAVAESDFGREPLQMILSHREAVVITKDVTRDMDKEKSIQEIIKADVERGFHLLKDSLIRMTIIKISHENSLILWTMHHIIVDGWCMSLLFGDLMYYYNQLSLNVSTDSLAVRAALDKEKLLSYERYVDYLKELNKETALDYWNKLLKGYTDCAGIPPIYKEAKGSQKVGIHKTAFNLSETKEILEFSKNNQLTVNTVVETAWGLLLMIYNRATDIVFGKVVSGRNVELPDIDKAVGLFINTIPVRLKSERTTKGLELLNLVQKQALESQKYEYCSLSEIQAKTDLGNELIQTLYVFENFYVDKSMDEDVCGLEIELLDNREETNYSLNLGAMLDEQLHLHLMYQSNIYSSTEIGYLQEFLMSIIRNLINKSDQKLDEIGSLQGQERMRITRHFNDTELFYEKDRTITELFEEQVEKTPEASAVIFHNKTMSYRELNSKSNQLAIELRNMGVKANEGVAVIAERNETFIIAMFGIMKAGGAYIPIDCNMPKQRMERIIADARCRIVICCGNAVEFSEASSISLKEFEFDDNYAGNLPCINTAHDLCYIIYTSGSSGEPKGVMVMHKGVSNYCSNNPLSVFGGMIRHKAVNIISAISMYFDPFVTESILPLLHGMTIVLADETQQNDPKEFIQLMTEYKGDIIQATPSRIRMYMQNPEFVTLLKQIKVFILGGEVLEEELVEFIKEHSDGAIFNAYGPTEATILSSFYQIKESNPYRRIPIGKPVANTSIYILDGDRLCGIGMPGELCIAGAGIAKGYLQQLDLTNRMFITNPFGEGYLYRTGDIARWLPDGNLDYMGRADEQVKLRGLRIELGEIKAVLCKIPYVKDAIVFIHQVMEQQYLCAYLVSDIIIDSEEIRAKLRTSLPDYMVPPYMLQIDTIPTTENGKLDRKALPEIIVRREKEYIAPASEKESKLAEIFTHVLGASSVGMSDNFFELGGDSIKAIQIISKLRQSGYHLKVKDIMQNPILSEIAILMQMDSDRMTPFQGKIAGTVHRTPIQREFMLWDFKQPDYFNQGIMITSRDSVSEEGVRKVLQALALHHDALRMVVSNGEQRICAPENRPLYELVVHDLSDTVTEEADLFSYIEMENTRVQASMDLKSGAVLKAALYKTGREDHLMLCAHHFAVDGVSWRILLEDFQTAYDQLGRGQTIELPMKTASIIDWSEFLQKYGTGRKIRNEYTYWNQVLSDAKDGKLRNIQAGSAVGNEVIYSQLDPDDTDKLLHHSNRTYGTKINDILLTGLLTAIHQLTGQRKITVELEGHGREELPASPVIDRTVGWFTSIYPVVLELSDSLEDTLILTKEMLRRIPNNGIGYGIIRNNPEYSLEPISADISFNYLGEFTNDRMEEMGFSWSHYSAGQVISEDNVKSGIVMNISISDGKLILEANFRKEEYDRAQIQEMCTNFIHSIINIIELCADRDEVIKTPSDYTKLPIGLWELTDIKEKAKLFTGSLIQRIYSLTPMQEGMLFHKMKDASSTEYVLQNVIKIHDSMDFDVLKQSLSLIAHKYDVLRTIFVEGTKEPLNLQVVVSERSIEAELICISGTELELEKQMEHIKEDDRNRGFDLQRDSLLRLTLIEQNEKETIILWTMHHIIVDGWCMSFLFHDLLLFYQQLMEGMSMEELKNRAEQENETVTKFGDYVEYIEDLDKEDAYNYWENKLTDYTNDTIIRSLEAVKDVGMTVLSNSGIHSLPLESELSGKITRFANEKKITVNTFMETVLGIMLQQYNRSSDVVFGKVVSGRNAELPRIDKTVGLFINTVPVRIQSVDSTTCDELLRLVQNQAWESEKFEYCSLAEIQKRSKKGMDLIKILYVFENDMEENNNDIEDEKYEFIDSREQTNYGLTFVIESAPTLQFKVLFDSSRYTKKEAELYLNRLKYIAEQMLEAPDKPVHQMESAFPEEKEYILHEFNRRDQNASCDKTVVRMLEEQSKENPNKIAVVDGDQKLTYWELNNRVNYFASVLRAYGIQADDPVGILAERDVDTIIAICAILKAGGAYVPIDSNLPKERAEFIIKDSQMKAIIGRTERFYSQGIPFVPYPAELEQPIGEIPNPPLYNKAEDLVYIIYTSGTTGQPKGTMIEHRAVVRLVKDMDYMELNTETKLLQTGSLSFDAATFEIWGALLNGGTLYFAPNDVLLDPKQLKSLIMKWNINTMWLTSSLFNQVVNETVDAFDSLTYLLIGGEKLSEYHVRRLRSHSKELQLINGYGPTENTTFTTTFQLPSEIRSIPIGKPISGTQVYIRNESILCGIGMEGELVTSGRGVSRGYLNQPHLTKERFIDNPYGDGKLYRTGDLARWLPDGNIEYIGRMDKQVKIRGYRIELEEIEISLKNAECVRDSVVITKAKDNGDSYIIAFLIGNGQLDFNTIRSELKLKLPDYMIPSQFLQVDTFPVNKNGKLDIQALANLAVDNKEEQELPNTQTEIMLTKIFAEVLCVQSIGLLDNFFESGGHSLSAAKVIRVIEERMGVRLSLREFFAYPIPKSLSEYIEEKTVYAQPQYQNEIAVSAIPDDWEIIPVDERSTVLKFLKDVQQKQDLYCSILEGGEVEVITELQPIQIISHQMGITASGMEMDFYGELDVERLSRAWNQLVKEYGILRTTIHVDAHEHAMQQHRFDESLLLPYAELPILSPEESATLLKSLDDMKFYYDREDCYNGNHLSNRPLYVKFSDTHGRLYISCTHLIFDGYSAQVIKDRLNEAYYRSSGGEPVTRMIKGYSEAVRFRQDIKEQELLNALNLEEFDRALETYYEEKINETITCFNYTYELDNGIQDKDIISIAEQVYTRAHEFTLPDMKIPVFLLTAGRDYERGTYLDEIGEYIDIIPFVFDSNNYSSFFQDVTDVACNVRNMGINIAALFLPDQTNEYERIKRIASRVTFKAMDIPVINHTALLGDIGSGVNEPEEEAVPDSAQEDLLKLTGIFCTEKVLRMSILCFKKDTHLIKAKVDEIVKQLIADN